MKKLFTFLLILLSHYCLAQTFGVRDFLLAQKSQDFELIGHFLIKYNNFHYSNDLLDGNCKGYQFKSGNRQLDVVRCLSASDNEKLYRFVLLYKVPTSDFTEFQKSLVDANYIIHSVTTTADGHKVIMWTLKDINKLSAFFVEETNGFYEITGA